jgi:hypothetical protein
VRTKNPEIDLGRNPHDFARKLGLPPISGLRGTTTRLQDQLQRLTSTRLSWQTTKDFQTREGGSGFIVAANAGPQRWATRLLRSQPPWSPTLLICPKVFREITCSAVPVDLQAIHQLRRSPLAIDIYVWLTYRMSYLRRPCLIPWSALEAQFGAEYSRARDLRRRFLAQLSRVLFVYPTARVSHTNAGLRLYPSLPHIQARSHFRA